MPQPLSKVHHALLGKILLTTHPTLAAELLSLRHNNNPLERDTEKIKTYFSAFCLIIGIAEKEFTGPFNTVKKADMRRLFLAAMLHLYTPHFYNQPAGNLFLPKGLTGNLCQVLSIHSSDLYKLIKKVVIWEKSYDDFRQSVNVMVEQLKGGAE